MRLMLIHGRFDPDEDMSDWGFNGPDIKDVTAVHSTYQSTFTVWFRDRDAADRAHLMTGWPKWDDMALEMSFHDDMLKTTSYINDGPTAFYGDWELQLL